MRNALAVWVLLCLAGCDLAVGVGALVAASRSRDDDDGAAPAPPPPDPLYHVWIASLADDAAAAAQETALAANGGTPDPAVWTDVGTGSASKLFDPAQAAASFNAILVQASDAQNYQIDAVEVLDAFDVVVATAGGSTFSNLVTSPANALGAPDGLTADTAAAAGNKAFFFTRYTAAIEKFRVNVWSGGVRASGDVEWSASWSDAGNETPGGAALSAGGTLYVPVNDWAGGVDTSNRDVRLVRFDSAGALMGMPVDVAMAVTQTLGNSCAALDSAGILYIASTVGDGQIQVRKYTSGLAEDWTIPIGSALFPGDRVEANSLAIAADDNPVVAGALDGAAGIDHLLRKLSAVDGNMLWEQTPSTDANPTYWHAVAADLAEAERVYSAGELTSAASQQVETFTRETFYDGLVAGQVWSDQTGDNQNPGDRAQAVAVDGAGNVYSAGFRDNGGGRNALLLKFSTAGAPDLLITYSGPEPAGHDEILDLAVDASGNMYAVGYETAAGQDENWWVRKYDATGSAVWTRTYHGAGEDRAVSVALTSTSVIVVGFETVSGGTTNVLVRKYVK